MFFTLNVNIYVSVYFMLRLKTSNNLTSHFYLVLVTVALSMTCESLSSTEMKERLTAGSGIKCLELNFPQVSKVETTTGSKERHFG